MKRHLHVVPEPGEDHDPLDVWPAGTLTAAMEALGSMMVGQASTVSALTRSVLQALEPMVQQRVKEAERTAVDRLLAELDQIHGPRLTQSQQSLITWMRARSRA